MEDGLVPANKSINKIGELYVLILVVVEDGLVLYRCSIKQGKNYCLNPCCSGRWSRTVEYHNNSDYKDVLILVVVEDGLVLDFIRLF